MLRVVLALCLLTATAFGQDVDGLMNKLAHPNHHARLNAARELGSPPGIAVAGVILHALGQEWAEVFQPELFLTRVSLETAVLLSVFGCCALASVWALFSKRGEPTGELECLP